MSVTAAATGLLQHIRHTAVGQAARMITTIDEVQDPVSAISVLLQVRAAAAGRRRGSAAVVGCGWAVTYLAHHHHHQHYAFLPPPLKTPTQPTHLNTPRT